MCCSILLFFSFLFSSNSFGADSLSYSGRLVKADGSPVSGPVNLKVDLAYTDFPNTILCSQNFSSVVLSNGVFHLKLDLVCPGLPVKTVTEILSAVPANFAAALRVSDVSNNKIYAFQEIHSMPFATVSESAKQLAQLGAANGEVLKWNDTTKKWVPGTPGGGGTVTNVTVTSPLVVVNGATTPALSMAQATATADGYLSSTDWNTFNNKVGVAAGGTATEFYRGDKSWQTLNTDAVPDVGMTNLYFTNERALGVLLDGFIAGPGAIVATDTVLQAFAKTQGQINSLTTDSAKYLIKNGPGDIITGAVSVGATGSLKTSNVPAMFNDVTNMAYVDSRDNLKVSKIGDSMSGVLTLDSGLKIQGGTTTNYVTIKGHVNSAEYNLFLPETDGNAGEVLQTDGDGNLIWVNPNTLAAGTGTVNSSSITNDSIVNADINSAAAIDQSKIAGLTTDLGNKISTNLNSGKILVGNVGNLATAVSVSGDATLDNAGVLTLANTTVTPNTYTAITVDAKGRVTNGTNPTTLAGYGITDTLVTNVSVSAPITITGTTAPLIAMPAATNAVNGYLTSADRAAFNAKQDAITASTSLNSREIRFNELTGNGPEYVSLKAPDALAANTIYTLPAADGTTGQVLTTNAVGILSWSTVATIGTNLAGDIGGTIGSNSIGTGKVTSSHLLDGTIANADINIAAGIDYSKLNVPALAIPLTALNASGTTDGTTYLAGDNSWKNFNSGVIVAPITGVNTTGITKATSGLAGTDSLLIAFNKLLFTQGDYVSKSADQTMNGILRINSLTGFIEVPTPTGPKEAANKGYVDSYGQWLEGAGGNVDDIYFNTGRVGIGTENPLVPLDVVSTSATTNTVTVAQYLERKTSGTAANGLGVAKTYVLQDAGGALIATNSIASSWVDASAANRYARMDFYSSKNNTQTLAMSIDENGRVGVGTTIPSAKLTVSSGANSNGAFVVSATGTTAGSFASSTFATGTTSWSQGTEAGNGRYFIYNAAATADQLVFSGGANSSATLNALGIGVINLNTAGATRMTVNSAGNIGVGVSNPQQKFVVQGGNLALNSISNASPQYEWRASDNSLRAYISHATETAGASGDENKFYQAYGYKTFYTQGAERVRIDAAGNVGIGVLAPGYKLDVAGQGNFSTTAANVLKVTGAGTGYADSVNGVATVFSENTVGSGGNVIKVGSAFAPNALIVKDTGNVGIGTTNPQAKLDISGGIKLGSMTACGASQEGSQRYNSTLKIMEFCDGVAWQSFAGSSSVPTGAIMAFDLATCPTGWSEYTQARGQFLRGIDNGAGVDPSGTRAAGNVQAENWRGFSLTNTVQNGTGYSHGPVDMGKSTASYVGNIFVGYWSAPAAGVGLKWNAADETRPTNVAVLYCRKN